MVYRNYSKGIDATMHMHKEVWETSDGEVLKCEREPDNDSDRCTVGVIRKSIPDMEIVTSRMRNC